jgi:hypothetical protein
VNVFLLKKHTQQNGTINASICKQCYGIPNDNRKLVKPGLNGRCWMSEPTEALKTRIGDNWLKTRWRLSDGYGVQNRASSSPVSLGWDWEGHEPCRIAAEVIPWGGITRHWAHIRYLSKIPARGFWVMKKSLVKRFQYSHHMSDQRFHEIREHQFNLFKKVKHEFRVMLRRCGREP